MPIIVSDKIPKHKFSQFHDILCATNGRYKENPKLIGNFVYVVYLTGDYQKQCDLWHSVTTNIVEKRKDQYWRKILRNLSLWWK